MGIVLEYQYEHMFSLSENQNKIETGCDYGERRSQRGQNLAQH